MPIPSDPHWTEYAKTFFAFLAVFVPPVLTAFAAIQVLKYGLTIEKSKQLNQELVKRRLKFYDDVAPDLNKMYCFYAAVGDWHSLTPEEIIKIKRCTDRQFHMYRHIFSPEVFDKYREFMKTYFFEFSENGRPAKLRLDRNHLKQQMGSYYDERWVKDFDVEKDCPSKDRHDAAYDGLMKCLADNAMLADDLMVNTNDRPPKRQGALADRTGRTAPLHENGLGQSRS